MLVIKNDAIKMLKIHEGCALTVYKCPSDKHTIGYGRNLDDLGITQDEANSMLLSDVERTIEELKSFTWFDDLCNSAYDRDHLRASALIDMCFNLGFPRFKQFKKMIHALEWMDYKTASIEMLNSRWAKQVGTRAIRLSNIIKFGRQI
ncbi:MAG: lysozyme [Helicobacteraceae bacterium]|nr:lysozyme [Helicobacteraceae bacterium]